MVYCGTCTMSPKQNCRSRRKNSAPKRVIRVDDDDEEGINKNKSSDLPKDLTALAKYIMEHNITEFFITPAVPDIFLDMVEKAKSEATNEKEVVFCCTLCNQKVYRSASGLQYHLMNSCPCVLDLALTCIICHEKYKDTDKMIDHIQKDHVYPYVGAPASEAARRRAARRSRLKIQMFAESSSVAEELERNYSSLSDYDEEPEKKEVSQSHEKEPSKKKDVVKDSEIVSKQSRGGTLGTYTSIQHPLAEAFLWTLNWRTELEEKFSFVHPTLQSNFSEWLVSIFSDYSERFRLHQESPAFLVENHFMNSVRAGKRNSKNVITSKINGKPTLSTSLKKIIEENDLKYQKLKLFESTKSPNSHNCTFYVGAPVWSMAWCPESIESDSNEQYLALCCHSGEHSVDPRLTYQEDVLLQIWNCGILPAVPAIDYVVNPFLAYGLALNIGPVWSVKWCPIPDPVNNLSHMSQRLGIIALASASGDVRLYSLPKPASNKGQTEAPSVGGVYSAPPNLLLRPLRKSYFGQCTCVCWSVEDGANFIVAGFASGHVAVWNLKCRSRLLSGMDEDVSVLYAFHTFRAHSKPVEDVVFCPFNSHWFVSVGADRCLQVWDIRNTDTDAPNFLPPKMSILYELEWSFLWCGVYASSDSAFSIPYFHGAVFLNLGSTANTLQNVVPPKAASWSVTACDWLNCVVGSDVAGSVVVNVCNNWNRQFISSKCYPRIVVSQTQVEWNDLSASTTYLRTPLKFNRKENSGYNLIFHDCDLSAPLSQWKDTEAHLRVRTFEDFDDESYDHPVAAINKVRWNPNRSSFTWLASATSSGFIRLHCMSGIVSQDIKDHMANDDR